MDTAKEIRLKSRMAGFILPSILIVVGALLILAVGILLVTGIDRDTSRATVDRLRAELAAEAGLEEVRGLLLREACNDDFLILRSAAPTGVEDSREAVPYLYLARGEVANSSLEYRYSPLFSTDDILGNSGKLELPLVSETPNDRASDFTALPWMDPVHVAWLEITDSTGRIVSRYAYWVEDLQSRVDAATAGNIADGGKHKRQGWIAGDKSATARFPAPGLNPLASHPGPDGRDTEPALDQVAVHALASEGGEEFEKNLIEGRAALISPDSVLAAAGISPPLRRDAAGHLSPPVARAAEENLSAVVRPYDEQPMIPCAEGIATSAVGRPKLNLNALLARPRQDAVEEMAAWIRSALPEFDTRKGGFPDNEDYIETLAANAIGYAAAGNAPVVSPGRYRGLGKSPVISETLLDINYLGYTTMNNNKVMNYQFILFAELLNHTNLPVVGEVSLSYEVGLSLPEMGAGPRGTRFDDVSLLENKSASTHDLVRRDGKFWSSPLSVSLAPGEYRFFRFAEVNYGINIGKDAVSPIFTLTESPGSAGLSLMWNGVEVDRVPSIMRDSQGLTFSIGVRKYTGKAAIPGHSYGFPDEYINNMGDPRIARYITGIPLSENSFPDNISPGRRNIRMGTIYAWDKTPGKLKTYGRVVPSEWPDGGHDAAVNLWSHGWSREREGWVNPKGGGISGTGPEFDPTQIEAGGLPEEGEAMTYLSDRGRFYSATELGRIHDPIMWIPTFPPDSGLDSAVLRGDGTPGKYNGMMPAAAVSWPLVQVANLPSGQFGGGNTLRIGRPEHPRFAGRTGQRSSAMPGTHAARLLDLFHAGNSRSEKAARREGPLVRIEGHININTATRDSLRATAAGRLMMDPKLSRRTGDAFDARMAPPIKPLSDLSAPAVDREADRMADAIIRSRPFATPSELACVSGDDGRPVFGNPDLYPDGKSIQWSDSAAEEVFGRVYESATVRSRNFRVWVIGQALVPTSPHNPRPEVLGEVRKAYTLFADPGERESSGAISPDRFHVQILYENDF